MAEPLVLLPGMMCDARLFAPQVADLSSDIAVMVAPIRDGERIEEIASAVLDALPARFALGGLSMGGIVAMEILRRAPERVTRLALMDTDPLADTPQIAAAREPMIVAARAGRLMDVMQDTMIPGFSKAGPMPAHVTETVKAMAATMGPEVFVRQVRALQRRRDQQSTLRKCKVPTLVLCGEEDRMCPLRRHEFMAELIPNATLKVIKGAGHLPTLEKPDETTQALRDWMDLPFVLRA